MRAGVMMLVLISLLSMNPVLACNPEPGPNHFPPPEKLDIPVGYFELHNTLTGLPCNNIRSLLALDNAVLAGTEGEGLLIFDGGTWAQYSPTSDPPFPSTTVSCFMKESDLAILAGTPNGIVRITNFAGEKKINFELISPEGPLGPDVLSLSLATTGTGIFAGTFYGAGILESKRINPFKILEPIPPTGFSSIKNHSMGTWFGSSDGLLELQGTTLVMKSFPPNDLGWVQALETDGKTLYIGGSKGLFGLYSGSCREIMPAIWVTSIFLTPGTGDVSQGGSVNGLDLASMSQGLKDTQAYLEAAKVLAEMNARYKTIMEGWNQGTLLTQAYNAYLSDLAALGNKVSPALLKGLWVGTHDSGLILFSEDGQRRHLTKDNSKLPSNRVTAISGLESGETWIGTYDGGILRYRKYVLRDSDKPDQVYTGKALAIETFGENLYVGTENEGLYVFNIRTISQLNHINPETRDRFHSRVESIAADREGNIWVAGNSGLWRMSSTGLKQFSVADGLPATETVKVTVDMDGRIYVAGKVPGKSISQHIAGFNGEGFTCYSVENLKAILAMQPGDRESALRTMGLIDTYQQAFDQQNATKALALYDAGGSEDRVSAMLATPRYLLIGTDAGTQYVFDGSGFKPLNIVGPGVVNKVVAYGKRGNGSIVTMAPQKLTIFNGQAFSPVFDIASPTVSKYTDLSMDDMNPDLFWASFESGGGGGFALYQQPKWDAKIYEHPLLALRRAFPFVFAIYAEGVLRFQL